VLEGAREHNLRNLSVEFPLQRMVVVTGVSGSGKSSLVQDILAPALLRHFGRATETPGTHDRLLGTDHLSDVVFVDQSPIGKTARSNPGELRRRLGQHPRDLRDLAAGPAARLHRLEVQLQLRRRPLPDLRRLRATSTWRCSSSPTCTCACPDCDGKRYRPEILEVTIEAAGGARRSRAC
jgi:excinuclease ABC subunit A